MKNRPGWLPSWGRQNHTSVDDPSNATDPYLVEGAFPGWGNSSSPATGQTPTVTQHQPSTGDFWGSTEEESDGAIQDGDKLSREQLGLVAISHEIGLFSGFSLANSGGRYKSPRGKKADMMAKTALALAGDEDYPDALRKCSQQYVDKDPTAIKLAQARANTEKEEGSTEKIGRIGRASKRVRQLVDEYKWVGLALPFLSNLDKDKKDGTTYSEFLGFFDKVGNIGRWAIIGSGAIVFTVMSVPGCAVGRWTAPDKEEVPVGVTPLETLNNLGALNVAAGPQVIQRGGQYIVLPFEVGDTPIKLGGDIAVNNPTLPEKTLPNTNIGGLPPAEDGSQWMTFTLGGQQVAALTGSDTPVATLAALPVTDKGSLTCSDGSKVLRTSEGNQKSGIAGDITPEQVQNPSKIKPQPGC